MQSGPNANDPNGTPSLSFAPVGLDLAPMDDDADEHSIDVTVAGNTASSRIPKLRSRGLARAALGGVCAGAILVVAAALALAGRRNADAKTGPVELNAAAGTAPSAAGDPPHVEALNASAAAAGAPETPSTGTLRLHRPASPGHVWLDGGKLTALSSLVSCGRHQIKIGARARPRPIDVPCGGEIEVTR